MAGSPRPTSAQSDLRQRNRNLALASVAQNGEMTRSDLAHTIGLTRPAVSRIVTDLIAEGWLVESAPQATSQPGRPTSRLALARGRHSFFGVDIRLEGILIQCRDLSGELLTESRHALPSSAPPETAISIIVAQIREDTSRLGRRPDGVGLAVGAGLDSESRIVLGSLYRPWRNVPLPAMIARSLGRNPPPVVMCEVASAAALANWQELATDLEMTDLVHLQIGIGSGAGIVRRRRGVPWVDAPPMMAHLPLQADGAPCRCGARGCLDATAGFQALVKLSAGTGLKRREGPRVIEDYCTDLRALAEAGDPLATASIREMAGWFARAGAMLLNIVRPTRFTYAGYPVQLGPTFHERFVEVLKEYSPNVDEVLVTTGLGDRASVVGAYWLAFNHLIASHGATGWAEPAM